MEHPDERPQSTDGWGNASEHVLGKKDQAEDPTTNSKPEEEPEADTPAEPEVPQVETAKVEAKLKSSRSLTGQCDRSKSQSQCDRDSDRTKKQSKPWDHG